MRWVLNPLKNYWHSMNHQKEEVHGDDHVFSAECSPGLIAHQSYYLMPITADALKILEVTMSELLVPLVLVLELHVHI